MATYSSDRRSLLKIFGSIGATCAYPFASDELFGQTAPEHHHGVPSQPSAAAHFFNDHDFAVISRVADLIIPETDSPGAVAAGVPAYIDQVVGRTTDHQMVVADGLRWLDKEATRTAQKNFLELAEEQQVAILLPLCEAADVAGEKIQPRNVQFFALIKSLAADGYYTSHAGLMEDLHYQGNAVRASYPACIPES